MADLPAHLQDLRITPFRPEDVAELVVLQRCCWVQEAIANDTFDIPPLRETAADVDQWASEWNVTTLRRSGRLVAAVRTLQRGTSWDIGRLMVVPDLAGQGLGRWLLARAESDAPADVTEYELFTGSRSERNIRIYRKAGYLPIEPADGTSDVVTLRKSRFADDQEVG